jgi:hypothetical protein
MSINTKTPERTIGIYPPMTDRDLVGVPVNPRTPVAGVREGGVMDKVNGMRDALNALHRQIEQLEERLSPMLPPANENIPARDVAPSASSLGNEIELLLLDIRSANDRIYSIMLRVDL